jgi:hypothetical protein
LLEEILGRLKRKWKNVFEKENLGTRLLKK